MTAFHRIGFGGVTTIGGVPVDGEWHEQTGVTRQGQVVGRCRTRVGDSNFEQAECIPEGARRCYFCSIAASGAQTSTPRRGKLGRGELDS